MIQGTSNFLMWLALAAYLLLRLLASMFPEMESSLLHRHGADILAPLVLIPLFTQLQVFWGLRSAQKTITATEIVAYVGAFSLIYEFLLPRVLLYMVGDPLDVASYALGGTILWMALRLSRRRVAAWRCAREDCA